MFFVDSTYRDSGGQISDIAVLRRAWFIRVLAPNPAWALPFVPTPCSNYTPQGLSLTARWSDDPGLCTGDNLLP